MSQLSIELIPCLRDNYAYLVRDEAAGLCAVVDPSEPEPVRARLAARGARLTHILNTHHHFDHTGGNLAAEGGIRRPDRGAGQGSRPYPRASMLASTKARPGHFGPHSATILEIPAHTKAHIAFVFADARAAFTGDTLFAMGCGRLFEGTPAMMWAAMQKLMALPDDTRVYCGHEYTLSNGRFALTRRARQCRSSGAHERGRSPARQERADDPHDHRAGETDQSVHAAGFARDPQARSGSKTPATSKFWPRRAAARTISDSDHGAEFAALLVEQFELAIGDAEARALKRKRAGRHALGDEGKGHQPLERQPHGLAFDRGLRVGMIVCAARNRGRQQIDPLRHERQRRAAARAVERRLDAAALGMADHDDVANR